MSQESKRTVARGLRAVLAVGAVAGVAAAVALTGSASAVASSGKVAATKACGYSAPVGPANPSGIYKSLTPALKAVYASDPGTLTPSVWAHSKPVKGPWKIGFIEIAIISPYQQDLLDGMKAQFAAAKAKGLVSGSLLTSVPATIQTTTPEAQIQAVQQMVRQGVNAIVIEPVAGAPLVPAIDAAGKAGIPVVISDIPLPQAKYGVVVWTQNQTTSDAGTLKLMSQKGGGGVLMVRGIAGNPNDVVLYNQAIADMKYCPNLHVADSIFGSWDETTAKTTVQQWLAAHPQGAAGVIQDGGMTAGVIQAFEAAGQSVPPISEGECYAGDLSWWLAHKATYQTVGQCINGFQAAYVDLNATLRILAGDGPKYQTLEIPNPTITNATIAKFAKPGLPLTSAAEVGGPVNYWCSDTCLNQYFNKPGTPGGR